MKKFNAIVIDLALKCNMNCTYCHEFENISLNNDIADIEIIKKIFIDINKMIDTGIISPFPLISWYGGEPLLIGIKKFKHIMDLQKRYIRHEVLNQINTNATLISTEWVELFREQKIDVIVSIDGPKNLNKNRLLNGNNSFDNIMRGIELLKNGNLPLKYINVITKENFLQASILYDFAKEIGAETVDFPACYQDNGDTIPPNDYANFLKFIYDIWVNDNDSNKPKKITVLSSIIEAIITGSTNCCTFSGNCGKQLYFNTKGFVRFCCIGWYNDPNYEMGNVLVDDYKNYTYANTNRNKILNSREKYEENCKNCDVYEVCRGGCLAQINNCSNNKTFFCKTRKEVIRYIKEKINNKSIDIYN